MEINEGISRKTGVTQPTDSGRSVEQFGNVILRPMFKTHKTVETIPFFCQKIDRDAGGSAAYPQAPRNFKAVDLRQADIENNPPGLILKCGTDTNLPQIFGANLVFLYAMMRVDQFSHIQFIFHDEYFRPAHDMLERYQSRNGFFLNNKLANIIPDCNAFGFVHPKFISTGNPF